ncbi:MAG: hypothetical protein IJW19_04135 [Clostridia bacterium]|nr:hypothetical protein [Clostridia bacterium]
MKVRRIVYTISILFIIIASIIFIGSFIVNKINSQGQGLEDFDYNNLSNEQIIETVAKYEGFGNEKKQYGDQSGIDDKYKYYDYANCYHSSEKITGILTVQSTKAINQKVKFTITSNLESGYMKIVVIKNGEIIEYIDVNQTVSREYDCIGENDIYIKIIASTAKMNISVERELQT